MYYGIRCKSFKTFLDERMSDPHFREIYENRRPLAPPKAVSRFLTRLPTSIYAISLNSLRPKIEKLIDSFGKRTKVQTVFADDFGIFSWSLPLPRNTSSLSITEAYIQATCDENLMIKGLRLTVFFDQPLPSSVRFVLEMEEVQREFVGIRIDDFEYQFDIGDYSLPLDRMPNTTISVRQCAE